MMKKEVMLRKLCENRYCAVAYSELMQYTIEKSESNYLEYDMNICLGKSYAYMEVLGHAADGISEKASADFWHEYRKERTLDETLQFLTIACGRSPEYMNQFRHCFK